ncbi:MAG: STAS domain-containing protein [Pseudonocardia sp.]|nr:STAS domain-containing protein [Pseudonocardia sp.]
MCPSTRDAELRVLTVSGEIDEAEAQEFQDAALRLLQAPRSVVLDLGAVTFLASRGIAALVRVQHAANAAGVDLTIVTGPANRAVLRPLEITGVDSLFRLVPTLAAPADPAP